MWVANRGYASRSEIPNAFSNAEFRAGMQVFENFGVPSPHGATAACNPRMNALTFS
jgi:hypothetical protein